MPMTTDQEIGDTKQCPYCAETIKREAILCRYCRSNVSQDRVSTKSIGFLDDLEKSFNELKPAMELLIVNEDSFSNRTPRDLFATLIFEAATLISKLKPALKENNSSFIRALLIHLGMVPAETSTYLITSIVSKVEGSARDTTPRLISFLEQIDAQLDSNFARSARDVCWKLAGGLFDTVCPLDTEERTMLESMWSLESDSASTDQMMKQSVEEFLEKLRPKLADDGCSIKLFDVSHGKMYAYLITPGMCPEARQTLEKDLRSALKKGVPEIQQIILVSD